MGRQALVAVWTVTRVAGYACSTMSHALAVPLPWFIVGPLMGLSVVGLYAIANLHLGVTGAYVQFVDMARGRAIETWRLWFLAGLLIGAGVIGVLGPAPQSLLGYGLIGRLLPLAVLIPVLFAGGVLIGFGARWSGACTSGHAISGCSARSPGSYAAAMTFFVTAVAMTLFMHVLTGGRL
jgi:uncharacterized membrane protein YedE/YeeE